MNTHIFKHKAKGEHKTTNMIKKTYIKSANKISKRNRYNYSYKEYYYIINTLSQIYRIIILKRKKYPTGIM